MITSLWITYALFTQAVQVTIHLWPLSGLVVFNALAAIAFSRMPNTPERLFTLLSPFLWPALILAVGGACWNLGSRMSDSAIPTIGVTVIFGIQIILSLGIIYKLAGFRWVASSVCLIAVWFGLICWFLSGMALTNVWL